ncbi:GDSL-type esterase/lipase family protein [Pantoea sp. C2G6]|uniref:GDSL-type esterase/lipase family protein n=1 Tax=Pantoea sp. C2G6 TaxID=3243084 RepID=UPI003EDA6F07
MLNYDARGTARLAQKLRNSASELTHIVVIGDSHTAADFLSGQIRSQLQSQYGNGGAGFISPLAVRGNRYSNVRFSKASGWKAENSRRSQNSAFTLGGNIATPVLSNNRIRISLTDGERFSRIQALYRTRGNGRLSLQNQSVALADTQGEWRLSDPATVPASFSVSATGKEVQLGGFWLTAPQRKGVIVSALGINGAQISMADKWPADWAGVLRQLHPDLVILAYGTNESFDTDLSLDTYRQTLRRQIRKIAHSSPEATILLIGPGSSIKSRSGRDCAQRQSAVLEPIIGVQKEVAQSESVLFWNWFDFMGGACSIEQWARRGLARPDLIHLSAEGYQQSASGLWRALSGQLF